MAANLPAEPDLLPFARRSAQYLYRHGFEPAEVARALADELDVSPRVARSIAIQARRPA